VLVELVIENYAVVEHVRVRFGPGLHVLTGETGSGKSIVVDALTLLFGGRASADMIRTGADRARVSGIFEPPEDPALQGRLQEAGIELEDAELLLEREILASGKSRASIGSRPVAAGLLRELAPFLGDIHGQHDQQRLFSPSEQLELLDEFAAVDRSAVASLFERHRAVNRQLADWDRDEQEELRLVDLWAFQKREIESAAPHSGEDAQLENELRVLRNVARLQENAQSAYEQLEDVARPALAVALKRLEELARIDESQASLIETLRPAPIAANEVARALRGYLDRLESDPQRLDIIQGRLAALERLKRKYGPTLEEVLAFLAEANRNLDAVEQTAERRTELERQKADLERDYQDAAARLTAERRAAADRLSERVQQELAGLAMGRTRFAITVEPAPWSAQGADQIQFLIAPNAGEDLKPLDRIASGGELSRVALALKTASTGSASGPPRTLVFDEVDAGIGGAAAEAVGRRLQQLAASNQVLCVTHLAQIAGFAHQHYSVSKSERGGRTTTTVEPLEGDARTREISRMLSGDHLTPEALKHAEQLIRRAH
jgi:DNA repair protein RecN (Recombination protein N)